MSHECRHARCLSEPFKTAKTRYRHEQSVPHGCPEGSCARCNRIPFSVYLCPLCKGYKTMRRDNVIQHSISCMRKKGLSRDRQEEFIPEKLPPREGPIKAFEIKIPVPVRAPVSLKIRAPRDGTRFSRNPVYSSSKKFKKLCQTDPNLFGSHLTT